MPLLQSGKDQSVNRKDPFFVFRYDKTAGTFDIAIVQDDYKLMKEIDSNTFHLWHLGEDLGEQNNLAVQMPEKVQQMYNSLTEYLRGAGWDESQAAPFPWEENVGRDD